MNKVMLLVNAGANVNAADRNGGTPLMAAVENGNLQMATILLSSGAKVSCILCTS